MKPVSFAIVSIVLILALLVAPALATVDRVATIQVNAPELNITIPIPTVTEMPAEFASGPPGTPEIPPVLTNPDPRTQSDRLIPYDPIREGLNVPAPVANFVGTPTSGIAPLAVSFTDLSSNSPTGWAWFFGDENFTAPWTQVNASSGWSGKYQHSSVAMPDGSIVLMGGWTSSSNTNDVWRSTDNGATCTQVNASAGWSARSGHSSVVMPDGNIVLMGGYGASSLMNDV